MVTAVVDESSSMGLRYQFVINVIIIAVTIYIFIRLKLTKQKQTPPFKNIPLCPNAHWLFGHLSYLLGDDKSLSFLFSDYVNEDGLCSQHMLKRPIVSVLDAEHARSILRQSSSRKQMPLTQRHLHFAMGKKSLVFAEGGQDWVEQRRAINSAFSALALVDYRPHVFEVARNIISSLQTMCIEGRNCSVQMNALSLSALFTIDVFGKVALGHDFNSSSEYNVSHDIKSEQIKAFEFLLDDLVLRCNPSHAFNLSLQLYWLPTKRNRQHKYYRGVVKEFMEQIIQKRKDEIGTATKSKGRRGENMLTRLIHMNVNASAEDLIEFVKTMLVAGYETTSVSISFVLYHIAKHPRVQERCLEEVTRIFSEHGNDEVINENEFKYTHSTIMESLRLMPTVLLSSRIAERDINIGKAIIPEGTSILLPLADILRSERNFERATEFFPERWVKWERDGWIERDEQTEENSDDNISGPKSTNVQYQEQNEQAETVSAANRRNFLAFSHGVRDCIGKRLANLEVTIFVAYIVKNFIVANDDTGPPLKFQRRLVTHFPHNLPITFRKRE